MEYPKFKVCARCFTFNQSKYITDTMNGFTMQKTDFPFICCIVDDASTDGEQDVIMDYVKANFDLSESSAYYQKETDYAHITYAHHKTNTKCFFAVLLLKENHHSINKPKEPYLKEWTDGVPYEALCEGDDYWIDPLKLQKQADYLDLHPEVGLVRTDCDRFTQKTGIVEHNIFSRQPLNCIKDTFDDYLKYSWWVAPCTWMFRQEFNEIVNNNRTNVHHNTGKYFTGDIFMILSISQVSIVHLLPDSTAVYRVLESSTSHFNKDEKGHRRFIRKVVNTRLFFAKKKPILCCVILYRYSVMWAMSVARELFIKTGVGSKMTGNGWKVIKKCISKILSILHF